MKETTWDRVPWTCGHDDPIFVNATTQECAICHQRRVEPKFCVSCGGVITTPLLEDLDEHCVHCADHDPDDPDIAEIGDIGHVCSDPACACNFGDTQ